jgi:hypothetical protein
MIGQVAQGASATFDFQDFMPDLVTPKSTYLITDTLTAKVWPGDDQLIVATPTASWIDVTVAQWKLAFVPADTATLIPGTYRFRVTATRGSGVVELLSDSVEITAVPGAAAAPAVYCTYEDMAAEVNWLQQFQSETEDQTGFAEQRKKAREWMDGMILRSAPRYGAGQLVSMQGSWNWGSGTRLAMDPVMAGYLAADGLMLTTPQGRAIVQACACYAISLVFQSQIGKENAGMANGFAMKARYIAATIVAEIDSNDDGVADYAIPLSVTNTRYA